MQLEADRVLLRDFRGDDVTELQRYHADPDFLEFYAPDVATPEHAKQLVELFVRTARAQPRLDFSLAVVDRGSAQLIGCCSLRTATRWRSPCWRLAATRPTISAASIPAASSARP